MGRRILGIDIGDSHIAGVVLEQQRGTTLLHGFHCLPINELENPAEGIRLLCQALGWDGEVALCGLPLSLLSIRNLNLPFSDVKKITQTLPFELEEQLLTPPDLHSFDFSIGRKNGNGCLLVVFAILQDWLAEFLAGTAGAVDPDRVLPAMLPLAEQCARLRPDDESFLLVHADLHSMSIALVMAGRPMLFRRLSHPETMMLHSPFAVQGDTVNTEMPAARECVGTIANLILQSLDFFSMENRIKVSPQTVVLAGPFAGMDDALITFMSQALNMSVERLDLLQASQVIATEQQHEQWHATQMDRALAVALHGRSKDGLNLRKGPLAKKTGCPLPPPSPDCFSWRRLPDSLCCPWLSAVWYLPATPAECACRRANASHVSGNFSRGEQDPGAVYRDAGQNQVAARLGNSLAVFCK